LIPRPETEHVVEAALPIARGARHVLDVGAGSGALAITLQTETGADTWATDISPAATAVARENARRLKSEITVVVCDLMAAIAPGSMDLIVSNPPYVPLAEREGLQREVRDWEPHIALFAGESGFDIYDRIATDAPRVLRPGGWLILELGFSSREHVAGLLEGWEELRIEPDLAGIPRVIVARKPREK
jgi:release factor glutamine methyltransferase